MSENTTNKIPKFAKVMAIVVAIIIVGAVANPFTIVTAGHTGVVLNWGAVSDNVLSEGIHFVIPIVQSVRLIDNRILKLEVDAASSSKDLQIVTSKIAVNYRVSKAGSGILYKNVGIDYANTILAPTLQESIKGVTAGYTAEELITRRQEVSEKLKAMLNGKMKDYSISIEQFNIVDFEFSKEFNIAIESKQTAQQLALKAQQDLIRIQIEAEQKISQAKAEAESLRLQKQEISAELLELRRIEAMREAIIKWDGKMPASYVGSGNDKSGLIFNIPVR